MIILLVDDEPLSLDNLEEAVSSVEPEAELFSCLRPEEALEVARKHPVDIAFLDISLRNQSGIDTAVELRRITPNINIIFATGYGEYMAEAFYLHASGYMMKPITADKVRHELNDLRRPVEAPPDAPRRIRIQTFGNFECFIDEVPVSFQYNKTREMLAYLVDRCGAFVTNGELMGILWEDSTDTFSHGSYLRNLKTDLSSTLSAQGCEDIVVRKRGMIAILPERVDCDYFRWKNGDPEARLAYHGEYMSQYSWGELTHGLLSAGLSGKE